MIGIECFPKDVGSWLLPLRNCRSISKSAITLCIDLLELLVKLLVEKLLLLDPFLIREHTLVIHYYILVDLWLHCREHCLFLFLEHHHWLVLFFLGHHHWLIVFLFLMVLFQHLHITIGYFYILIFQKHYARLHFIDFLFTRIRFSLQLFDNALFCLLWFVLQIIFLHWIDFWLKTFDTSLK